MIALTSFLYNLVDPGRASSVCVVVPQICRRISLHTSATADPRRLNMTFSVDAGSYTRDAETEEERLEGLRILNETVEAIKLVRKEREHRTAVPPFMFGHAGSNPHARSPSRPPTGHDARSSDDQLPLPIPGRRQLGPPGGFLNFQCGVCCASYVQVRHSTAFFSIYFLLHI